jgi:RNA polymerase sigma-70 factor, ECF subfamily
MFSQIAEKARRPGMDGLVDNDQFLTLLTSHQRRLAGYLRALVSNRADTEELLQEVNLYICRHADDFKLGTDFAAWVLKIAHFRVLAWRQRQSRDRLVFDDSLVEQLAVEIRSVDTPSERRRDALERCLKKLPPPEHELITQLYGDPKTTPQCLAERLGRSLNAIHISVHRIRARLFDCIQRTLAAEGRNE